MQKILVVDDDDALRGTIIAALKRRRFKVLEARNGTEGIKIAAQEVPDLILCDLNLNEKDGSEPMGLFRDHPATAHVPLILMTGQSMEHGCGRETLLKPFGMQALLKAIGKHLKQQKSRPPEETFANGTKGNATKSGRANPGLSRGGSGTGGKPSIEELKQLLARVQSLREAERAQLARRIHDDLSQKLTVLAIELSLLESTECPPGTPDAADSTLRKLGKLVNELIGATQEITAQLRPKVLDEFGLVAAMEWLVQTFRRKTGVECELILNRAESRLAPEIAATLFRLSEEILSRVDSNASAVAFQLEERKGWFLMEFSGNNTGMNGDRTDNATGLDLLVMRERAERLNGTFSITEEPGNGVKITVRVPVGGESS